MDINNIPSEVAEAWAIHSQAIHGLGIGIKSYERYLAIVDKYPEWFQWEYKYKAIPHEVHKAFELELNGIDIDNPYNSFDKIECTGGFDGIMSKIKETPTVLTEKSMKEMITDMFDRMEDDDRIKRKKLLREKKIWNKHYSKYNLEYR